MDGMTINHIVSIDHGSHGSCSRIPGPGRAPIRRIIFTTEFHPDRGRMDRSGPSFW